MRIFMIFMLLFGCYSTLTNSRPSLQEENDSEIGGGEYESEESVDDEYVPEEGDSPGDEPSEESMNSKDGIQSSEDQELIQNSRRTSKHLDDNREGSEKFTESEMRDKNENNPSDLRYRAERFSAVKEHPKYIFSTNNAAESDNSQSSRTDYQKNRVDCKNSEQVASDNSGDLFKRFHDHMKMDKSDYVEDANERSNLKNQFDRPLENKAAKRYDYVYFPDRNRRQVQNLEEKPVTLLNNIKHENNNLDVVNESAILKNIKKLSEQDLEDLMNSLPEDKKALLKKIMDKREITKKAGAIEDNSYLDQSDTSKIEGSYSVNTNSVSSLFANSETTETNKQIESGGGLNTKVSDSESESGKSGSKSGDMSDTSTTEELLENTDTSLKDEKIIHSDSKESLKSENKREINQNFITNKNTQVDNSLVLDTKNSNNLPIQEENSENEDWLEPQNEDLIAEQEVSQGDSSDLSASVEKLEESFPNANGYGDTEADLEPLIRIKRKELQHKVKKRDLPFLANDKISFISDSLNEGSENEETNEFNYKDPLYSQSDCLKKDADQYLTDNIEFSRRKKRSSNFDDIINTTFNNRVKLNGSGDILHNKNNLMPDYPMDKSQYQIDEAFGSFSRNSDENLNRYKRIRRVKNVSNSSITDV